jgi:DNA-binding response OmpR family regulator
VLSIVGADGIVVKAMGEAHVRTVVRIADTCTAEPRRALNDDPAARRFIEKVTGQGYRFVGQVKVVS